MTPSTALAERMTDWRRAFHRHPEIGFDLPRTSARVAELLADFGLEVHEGLGGCGVVGVLQRGTADRALAIRADMDALPITEVNDLPHASEVPGRMHACGHDGHMSMALGAAATLAAEGGFSGRAVFVFQPDEEHGRGARAMVEDGLFTRFPVDAVFGMHNIPGLGLGRFATRPGPVTASEALFEIALSARGGHAALPHMGADAITIGAQIVGALQTIVARKLDPAQNGVVSVTGFETDGARNVLPGWARLSGDARALTPQVDAQIEAAMRRIVDGICTAHDVSAQVRYDTIFPATINAPGPVEAALRAARAIGADMDGAAPPKLFSEDFAHMAAAVPGCFVLMGNGETGRHARPLHAADYEFNDAALAHGAAFWTALVRNELPTG